MAAVYADIFTEANYLISGYWAWSGYDGTQPRHWASTSISVNVNGLTADEQILVGAALSAWSRVAPFSFSYTGGAADITYNHNGPGAIANTTDTTPVSGQLYQAETVDISTTWFNINDGSAGIISPAFQTYLHETGHALGLGHLGPYNNGGTYGTDNIYTDDTTQYSVMSYFDQTNYGTASSATPISPQMADIYAIQSIYGAPNNDTTDKIYGFNGNAGPVFDFAAYPGGPPAFTIYKPAGNNTLDASGYRNDQIINLNFGAWSSIGGLSDNVGIYLNTRIQNAIGGAGDDLIIPNGSIVVSTLTGGGGNDTFQGMLNVMSDDRITDMNYGDRINFTDGSLNSFGYTRKGTALDYGQANPVYLTNDAVGHFAVTNDAKYGGVDLTLMTPTAMSDFSDDGKSDVLWRSTDGTLADWSMSNGTIVASQALNATPDASWTIADIADFNGDGRSDVLWRNIDGTLADWSMKGGSIAASQQLNAAPDASWSIAGVGDFNGDHRSDILWRHDDGTLVEWQMNGGTISSSGSINAAPDASWSVAGIGDFNRDGKSDILWRNDNGTLAEWQMKGTQITSSLVLDAAPDASWSVAGIGDFFGSGYSDILWRNTDGSLVEWLLDGSHVAFSFAISATPDSSWSIAEIGDFNDDGKSDLLWRQSTTGELAEWKMAGFSILSSDVVSASPDASWQVQAKPTNSAV